MLPKTIIENYSDSQLFQRERNCERKWKIFRTRNKHGYWDKENIWAVGCGIIGTESRGWGRDVGIEEMVGCGEYWEVENNGWVDVVVETSLA